MKKIHCKLAILTAAVLLLGMLAAGCGGNVEPASQAGAKAASSGMSAGGTKKDIKDIKVGVSIGHLTEERWQREIQMFKDYANEKGFDLEVQVAQEDTQKQVAQCENLINQGIDVLIIQSLDADACTPIVQAAHEAGIKVISYDRFIMNCDLDYYITFDSVKVGETQAKFVVSKAPKGNYIWLKGASEDNNAHLVAQGQKNILQKYIDSGEIKIVLEQWVKNWDPNEALKLAENGLTAANNDIQGVIASNDGTAGGAVQALAAQKLSGKVPICGQDADLAACQRIVEGTQTGTVYKPLAKMNKAGIELAVALATGAADPKAAIDSSLGKWTTLDNNYKKVDSFSVDVVAIDKSNLYDILIKRDGFHTVEEVYKNVPKSEWPKG